MRSALAVVLLMTNSNRAGGMTGNAAGVAPLRIRPAIVWLGSSKTYSSDCSRAHLGPFSQPTLTVFAISAYRHRALANCICRGDLHSGSSNRGLTINMQAQRAREVATFNRLRL